MLVARQSLLFIIEIGMHIGLLDAYVGKKPQFVTDCVGTQTID